LVGQRNVPVWGARTSRFLRQSGGVDTWTFVGKFLDEGIRELTTVAIFPRALPAAALVDVRPEVVPGVANFSVVCLVLAGACAGLLAAVLLPAF